MFINGKILITGGAGYIGSHALVQLLDAGAEVIVLDNLCNSKCDVIDRIQTITSRRPEFIFGDIRDRKILRNIFEKTKIGAVIHFAGLKAVGESVVDPLKYYDNNVSGSITLFQEMTRAGVKVLVFSSSASVYGDSSINCEFKPIKEDSPLKPVSPYGQSKLIVEGILADMYRIDPSWSIACLRYFNPVGAHSSGLIGEKPCGQANNLMPLIAQVALGERDKLQIYGGDYPTLDGTGVRDYIHVDDLVSGHLAALKVIQKPGFIAVNLGTGQGCSVLEIIKAFEVASGKSVPFEIVSRRPGDVASSYADPMLAKELLGWESCHDIESICNDAWRWYSHNFKH